MKVLIVVDMQNDFIDGALGTKEAVAIVPNVIETIKGFEGTILYTKDTHFDDYMDTQEGKNLPVPHCIKGTDGWNLAEDIETVKCPQDKVFEKMTFGSKELGDYLQRLAIEEDIEEITLVGLCTDICVISNALLVKAYLPEVPVAVLQDAYAEELLKCVEDNFDYTIKKYGTVPKTEQPKPEIIWD